MNDKIKYFLLGAGFGTGLYMGVEGLRDFIREKKLKKQAEEWKNQINEEFGIGGETFMDPPERPETSENEETDSDLASEMLKEKQIQYNKYEEEAKKYHKGVKSAYEVIDEEAERLEKIEEYDEDDEEEAVDDDKYANIDKKYYFIDEEDVSNGGLYDYEEYVFCADGVLVKIDDESTYTIRDLFDSEIIPSEIYEAFTRNNYKDIYIRAANKSIDYVLTWTNQSYKEAYR